LRQTLKATFTDGSC